MRLEIIQDAFEFYLTRLNETYAGNKGGSSVQLLIKDIKELRPVLEVQQSFNLKTLLNPVQLQSIFLGLNLRPGVEVDEDKIKQYLSNLKLVQPQMIQNHPFIIKSFNRIQRDVGTIMSSYKPLLLAVTLDKHIIGFDTEDGSVPDSKPVCKYVIENTELIMKSKQPNVVAELKHTIPGMIFDSRQSILVRFVSQDEFEELSFYLGQYRKK